MDKQILKIKVKGVINLSDGNGLQIRMEEIKGFIEKETEYQKLIKKINKNFLIRYAYFDQKQTFLIGAGQYKKLVTEKTAIRHFKTVLDGKESSYTFKIRKSLKIDFLQK